MWLEDCMRTNGLCASWSPAVDVLHQMVLVSNDILFFVLWLVAVLFLAKTIQQHITVSTVSCVTDLQALFELTGELADCRCVYAWMYVTDTFIASTRTFGLYFCALLRNWEGHKWKNNYKYTCITCTFNVNASVPVQ